MGSLPWWRDAAICAAYRGASTACPTMKFCLFRSRGDTDEVHTSIEVRREPSRGSQGAI